MKWVQKTLLMAIVLSGCKSQSPLADPFGRTRLPPPPTGSVSGSPMNSYNSGSSAITGPATVNTGTAGFRSGFSTRPGYTNPPTTVAPLWSPPATPGAAASGLASPSGQPSTTNYTGNSNSGATASAPGVQSGMSASPVSTPNTPNAPNTPVVNPPPGNWTPPRDSSGTLPVPPLGAGPGNSSGILPPSNLAPAVNPNLNGPPNSVSTANINYSTPWGGNSPSGGISSGTAPGYPSAPSSNRFPRPFFRGGVPNRTTIPLTATRTSPQPVADQPGGGWLGGENSVPLVSIPTSSNSVPLASTCNPPPGISAGLASLRPVPDAIGGSPVALASYATPSAPVPAKNPAPAPPSETHPDSGWESGE
jgi:hypothetical protein